MRSARAAAKAVCLLLLAACFPVAAAPAVAASFQTFWSAAKGQTFERQLQWWDRAIETPRRGLYASVVWEKRDHPDWEARRRRWLRARFAQYPAIADGIPREAAAIRSALEKQSVRFRGLFPDASPHPPVVLVLAPNFDAKSGVLADGKPVLALAVDSLLLERANLHILLPHELFHLYHAAHAGIRNDGVMPGVALTLPLFEEGLATYVSGQVSPGYGDGDLLLQDDLGQIPANRLPDIARRFLVDARSKAIDHDHPEIFKRWFNSAPTPYQQDLPNRTGYWLGLQMIRYLRRSYTLQAMVAWSPVQADEHVMAALKEMGRPHQ